MLRPSGPGGDALLVFPVERVSGASGCGGSRMRRLPRSLTVPGPPRRPRALRCLRRARRRGTLVVRARRRRRSPIGSAAHGSLLTSQIAATGARSLRSRSARRRVVRAARAAMTRWAATYRRGAAATVRQSAWLRARGVGHVEVRVAGGEDSVERLERFGAPCRFRDRRSLRGWSRTRHPSCPATRTGWRSRRSRGRGVRWRRGRLRRRRNARAEGRDRMLEVSRQRSDAGHRSAE